MTYPILTMAINDNYCNLSKLEWSQNDFTTLESYKRLKEMQNYIYIQTYIYISIYLGIVIHNFRWFLKCVAHYHKGGLKTDYQRSQKYFAERGTHQNLIIPHNTCKKRQTDFWYFQKQLNTWRISSLIMQLILKSCNNIGTYIF